MDFGKYDYRLYVATVLTQDVKIYKYWVNKLVIRSLEYAQGGSGQETEVAFRWYHIFDNNK